MMAGFWLVFGIWMALYGLNVPVRAYLIRRHCRQHEVLQRVDVQTGAEEKMTFYKYMVPLAISLLVISAVRVITREKLLEISDVEALFAGMLIGLVTVCVLWPFYFKSRTRREEAVLFDRDGVTMFAPRVGLLTQGPFQTRIDWKDCFGYSVFRGHVMLALRPIGHVEQLYGAHREMIEKTLNQLGIPKLNAYDVIRQGEVPEATLRAAEEHVFAIAQDVAAGFSTELAGEGLAVSVELSDTIEGEPEHVPDAHCLVRFRLLEGDKVLQQLDWLIWALYDDTLELLSLPAHQYYEELDGRVQSLVDSRMRELGVAQKPVVLQ
ncbi:hypothetical protein EV586_103371 [Tumebacillus sp. BK434]|uniref:hypothetical protein n=1 Tax=Tumebacillus sp. BK434 TaxID=2512169 RepID=UPI001045D91B|nr:hypothetical protein [Tumebacillus sp. BK434]TCP55717.1 hypothetical protein EV586_103371 [Tumebacillus sp. BK434]